MHLLQAFDPKNEMPLPLTKVGRTSVCLIKALSHLGTSSVS